MSHRTRTGRAVTVADTNPADAVADNGRHAPGSIHNQICHATISLLGGGAVWIVGAGNTNPLRACSANRYGFTPPGAAGAPHGY
jgi:hypothetical protein